MTRLVRGRPAGPRLRACGGLFAVLAAAAVGVLPPASARADDAVTVSLPPTAVTDGQAVTITVKAPPGFVVNQAEVNICRPDVAFTSGAGLAGGPPLDFIAEGGNCPPNPGLSTSGSARLGYPFTVMQHAADPAGVGLRYLVGAGSVNWKPADKAFSLTCDATHACDLVVELLVTKGTAPAAWQPFKQRLGYAADDPFAGCGGPAAGLLKTGAADRMIDTWVNWTIGECGVAGRKGAAGGNSFAGEREAVRRFAGMKGGDGTVDQIDLAYTALGYDDQVGMFPADATFKDGARRPAVAVPVALNAAVIAVAGGDSSSGVQVPYRDIKLSASEAARLVSAGSFRFAADPEPPAAANGNKSYEELALARNPQLKGSFFQNSDAAVRVGIDFSPTSVSWLATRMFAQLAPDAWRVPNASLFGSGAGKARGVDLALGEQKDPAYDNGPDPLSGRALMLKALVPVFVSSLNGGIYFLTDLATANALGLSPVQIENAAGQFVAPTAETLDAAVPKMTRDSYGVLISDPKATAAAGQVQPYPLTFVEYALAPAQPLLAEDCTNRTQSQALLKGWLQYVTGPGQAKLAPGMFPLTAGLQSDAAAAIPKVGASPVTGACKDSVAKRDATSTAKATTTTVKSNPTTSAPASDAGNTTDTGGHGGSGSELDQNGGFEAGHPPSGAAVEPPVDAAADGSPTPDAGASTTTTVTVAAIPDYGGKAATSYGGTVLGLAGILAMASLAAVGEVPLRLKWRRPRADRGPTSRRAREPT